MRIMINFSVPSHLKIKNTAFEIKWASFYLTKLSLNQPQYRIVRANTLMAVKNIAYEVENFLSQELI